ncbi:MAG: LuxR C-terminal-related transcriptional regulator, partial [Muribaculaceae bacterium]|nr:LuxR C-terminal-related transcriptional regulator [Muribaculaceae bacterium]
FVPAVQKLEEEVDHKSSLAKKSNRGAVSETVTPDSLTDREKEIICCVARGLSNKEIADRLCVSVHTVTTHRRNICAKLEIHSSAALAIYAIIHGLLDLSEINPQ